MGVDYDAILMVGEKFNCKKDALEFVMSNIIFTEKEKEEIEESNLQDFLECENKYGFTIDKTNHYTDDSYTIVGFEINDGDPQRTINEINEAVAKWQKIFKRYPRVISESKVW